MATSPTTAAPVDPNELGRREFTRIRKGWDPIEVRAHLLQMADEIKRLQSAETALRAKLERFETAESEPEELDEAKLTRLLGEETARVLEAARTAGTEIRSKAEENAARLVREAQEQATRLTRDADELRLAASREADELLGSARSRADELVAEAREQAEATRAEAEAEATALRERAGKAAAEVRAEAEEEAERLRAAAQATKTEAEDHATRVRREADEQAASLKSAAEVLAAEMRAEAEAAAERVRAEAAEAAKHRAEEAERSAEAEIEMAREQGRTMVHEAREARERMLRDLAERRKVARQQLEALRAGRERLLEAFRTVRTAFDDATDELVESLPAARAAADDAARSVDDDIEAAIAELDASIAGSLPKEAEPDEPAGGSGGDDASGSGGPTPAGRNGSRHDAAGEIADGASAHPAGGEPGEEEPTLSRLRLVPLGAADDDLADEDDEDEEEDEHGGSEAGDSGSVEEIFARLRAGQTDDAGEDDEAGDGPDAVILTLESDRAEDEPTAEDGDTTGEDDATDELGDGADTTDDATDDVADDATDDVADDEVAPTHAVTELLDRRDELLAPVERSLGRRLKRVLSDQENSVLHTVRRDRKARTAAELLGDADERAAALVDAAVAELAPAVAAGAGFVDDDSHTVRVDATAVAADLADRVQEWLTAPLRERLERAVADSDLSGDRGDLVDRVRASFRELKNDRLGELTGDLLTLAFNRGIVASATAGTLHVWIVDHEGLPCPEGEDNHLAGEVVSGQPFPTGVTHPPAQPGCRCLLAPPPR
jgi:cell division septum initiation protein DivIVA